MDDAEDLRSNLLSNIKKTGFPSELRVANEFKQSRWQCKPNVYFVDKDENKGREVDLICNLTTKFELSKTMYLVLNLAVEVKKTTNKHWVIFSSEKENKEFNSRNIKGIYSSRVKSYLQTNDLTEFHPTNDFDRIGRTHYEAFLKEDGQKKDNQTNTSSAIIPSVKAAMSKFDELVRGFEAVHYTSFLVSSLVVLDGRLFESYLDEYQRIQLHEVKYIPFLCNYTSEHYKKGPYLVDIVTIEYLSTYLEKQKKWIDNLGESIFGAPGKIGV